ncbi:MAG: hypothetical protein J7L61_03215, partial [Thermoplasmata archaeon]|nr:hypothetical protein [Thermoplasmata archaeon]
EVEDTLLGLQAEMEEEYEKLGRVLGVIDELFSHLPKDILDRFVDSPEFELYSELVDKYALSKRPSRDE